MRIRLLIDVETDEIALLQMMSEQQPGMTVRSIELPGFTFAGRFMGATPVEGAE